VTAQTALPARLVAIADDFADTYRLDRFQRDKLRELLQSMPALLRAAAEPEAKAETWGYGSPHDGDRIERTPEGKINNCAVANGYPASECHMCGGTCPDGAP
jgi:hypothetical protein